jgi:hypothetical protein
VREICQKVLSVILSEKFSNLLWERGGVGFKSLSLYNHSRCGDSNWLAMIASEPIRSRLLLYHFRKSNSYPLRLQKPLSSPSNSPRKSVEGCFSWRLVSSSSADQDVDTYRDQQLISQMTAPAGEILTFSNNKDS